MKIAIDPTSRYSYATYYIKGFYDYVGRKNVFFSNKYFCDLKRRESVNAFDHYMAFVFIDSNGIKRCIIDFWDIREIDKFAYDWCDVYAKINIDESYTSHAEYTKLLSIPPGFGIKIWGLCDSIRYGISNLVKCRFNPICGIKSYFRFFASQVTNYMLRIELYEANNVDISDNYVFHASTLWEHDSCRKTTNKYRLEFFKACKSLKDIDFEGGFFANPLHSDYDSVKDFVLSKRYSKKEYIEKTKKSLCVFNTPAVWDCHGWKLGEYFAMGKIIISTPLSRKLPEKETLGESMIIVHNKEEMIDAIKRLRIDKGLRIRLASGVNEYYEKYAKPRSVVARIIEHNFNMGF
jgi:hypothetical protein